MSLRPKALLFDWDNTLVDSWGTIHDAWVHTLTAMGHRPWTLEETRANVRKSLRDTFPEIFGGRWEEARALYLARFRAIPVKGLTRLAAAPLIGDLFIFGVDCHVRRPQGRNAVRLK